MKKRREKKNSFFNHPTAREAGPLIFFTRPFLESTGVYGQPIGTSSSILVRLQPAVTKQRPNQRLEGTPSERLHSSRTPPARRPSALLLGDVMRARGKAVLGLSIILGAGV